MTSVIAQTTLVAGLRHNQPWAYQQLYDDYAARLLSYLIRLVKDQGQAEDLLQDTFIKVWQSIATYEANRGGFSTWLLRVAHNTALDYLRSKKTVSSLDQQYPATLPTYTPTYHSIGLIELVARCLSANQQLTIDLLYFQGYTMQEAAVHLGLPVGTVKTHSRTALQRLKFIFR